MTQYGAQFSEVHALLAVIDPASYAAEQNTGWINVAGYERVAVLIIAGDIGTSLDADIEIATDDAGTDIFTLKSMTQLTEAGGDDNADVVIELRAEEFSCPVGADGIEYDYMRVELTPVGATIVSVIVLGFQPKYAPVSVTDWTEVVP